MIADTTKASIYNGSGQYIPPKKNNSGWDDARRGGVTVSHIGARRWLSQATPPSSAFGALRRAYDGGRYPLPD